MENIKKTTFIWNKYFSNIRIIYLSNVDLQNYAISLFSMRDFRISRFETYRNLRCEIFESRDFFSSSRFPHLVVNETRFWNLEIFFSSRCIEISRFFNEIQKSRDFFFSRFSRLEFYASRFSRLEFIISRF